MPSSNQIESAERAHERIEARRQQPVEQTAEALILSEEMVDHPAHYGGENDPYEAIKVIEAWKLNFNLGNTVKYINRAPRKGTLVQDLKKARWYLDREIANLEGVPSDGR